MSASPLDRRAHWAQVWATRPPHETSWHQDHPGPSLALVEVATDHPVPVLDVGGGASTLADHLVARGFDEVWVLDLSDEALARVRARLGDRVRTVAADVTTWRPPRRFALWHDRAAFHFLAGADERAAYRATLDAALLPGGHAIIATFAPDGPARCSDLPVVRYSPASLLAALGPADFELLEARYHTHRTPAGREQRFQFSLLRRRGPTEPGAQPT